MSNTEDAAEQAYLVAQIRGRIPRFVHLPHRYGQGVSSFEWNKELQKYVELRSKEEIDNVYRKPVRNDTTASRSRQGS
jgi:hypothetical protein